MQRGATLVYDVNTNTNYNPDAEQRAGRAGTPQSGPGAIAVFLGGLARNAGDISFKRSFSRER